jgi:phosphate transport system permease protein
MSATVLPYKLQLKRESRAEDAFRGLTMGSAFLVLALLAGVLVALVYGSWPALKTFKLGFLTQEVWNPVTEQFGALAPLYGTVVTSLIAMLIAVPFAFGIAVFLTETCPRWLRGPIATGIELLAAVPSIVFGIWGLFVLAPILQHTVQPWLIAHVRPLPLIGNLFRGPPFGIGFLTAGLVLAVMVLPFITAVMREVFLATPRSLKEAAYGLGATQWEVVWDVVLPNSRAGVIGGIMLGLGRALGETMAVTFVVGNAHRISSSLLAPGTTISATIAGRTRSAAIRAHLHHHRCGAPAAAAIECAGAAPVSNLRRRRTSETIAFAASATATLVGLAVLAAILWTLLSRGLGGLSLAVFTHTTPAPGSSGGLLNALYGSLVMTALGVAIGAPIGILAATYLAEYGRAARWSTVVRFINDVLLSAPSIIVGLFVYTIMVVRMGHFSAISGAVALAIIVIPVTVRTSEDMLRLVPQSLRHGSAALGAQPWRTITRIVYPAARSGMVTGVLLAVARVSGETAPLLFTALNNQFWSSSLMQPMANLPVVIFQFAMSPYSNWQSLAWTGALLITVFVLFLSVVARLTSSLFGTRESRIE